MKRIAAIIAVLVLFPAISFASQDMDAMKAGTPSDNSASTSGSRVYVVSGDVYVTQGKHPAHRVVASEPIESDSMIETKNGSAALLKFADGQVVTMQANSLFKVREYRYDPKRIGNSSAVFSMFQGGMRFITGLIGKLNHQSFRLSTPNVTIGIRGTEFMLVMDGKSMYSRVLKGKITMTNAAGMKIVQAGHTAVVSSSVKLASLVAGSAVPAGTFDELMSVPVEPSAIPAPAPEPVPVPEPAPAPVTPVSAVPAAAASAGIAGAAMAAGMSAGESEPATTTETAPPVEAAPAAGPETSPVPEADQTDSYSSSDLSLTGKIGTLGLGAELDIALTDSLGTRIGLNAFTYKYNANSSTVNYDFNMKLQTVSALADWYPFDDSSFRTSVGVVYNNNKVSLDGQPTGGTYTINGNPYSAGAIGSLHGDISFNKLAPYIGIGWGKPAPTNQGWGMTTDFGVLFQGSPKTSLTVTCTGIGTCPTASDIAAENTKLQNDLSNFKFWPVASIGISYQW